jgi:NAD(P)-dependent dehydrogenase (short-subunit alcohol dehydrogenase family)
MKMFSLQDKVAVVTGATGLLGRQHCIALAEAGAIVAVTDLDKTRCRQLAETLATKSVAIHMDVTDQASIEAASEYLMQHYGHIDILVNNAAQNEMVESHDDEQFRFENYPLGKWRQSVEVNITGVFNCAQIIGRKMVSQGSGSVINIASTYATVAPDQSIYKNEAGEQTFIKSPVYPTTKGAILSLTKYLAAYWGETGVRVNALSPGGVENGQPDYFKHNYSARTPVGRMAKPTEYRGAIVFLASEASAYMNGANLVVDGGWTVW